MGTLFSFFETHQFLPHGSCLLWLPELLALHVGADLITGLAYLTIPLALAYFVRHRPDVQFRWVFWMFVAFITLCGVTHLFSVYTLWEPAYGTEGMIKLATAGVSAFTAAVLWWKMPAALALPSRQQLEMLNERLVSEASEREVAQSRLTQLNEELEQRVHERTRDLQAANIELLHEVDERKKAQEEQRRLLAELDHRVKNTLATVMAITHQTLRQDRPLAEARTVLDERLQALGDAHDLLSRARWGSVPLVEVVATSLAPYANESGDNVSIDGPAIDLGPSSALYMGLVCHELATNAAKYGALSRTAGRVAVDWTGAEDGWLRFEWREEGGGPARPDSKPGFGTKFIDMTIMQKFGGTATRSLGPHGLAWRFELPRRELEI